MTQGIPKSVRDVLARQTPAEQHPSADLLNGYVEQTLTASERAMVMNHIAACQECREIAFLAGTVAEEELISAAAVARPKANWVWWRWAVPAVAVIAIAAGGLIGRNRILAIFRPAATETVAVNQLRALSVPANQPSAEPANPSSNLAVSAASENQPKSQPLGRAKKTPSAQEQETSEMKRRLLAMQQAQMSSAMEIPKSAAAGGSLAGPQTHQAAAAARPQTAEVTSAAPLVQADKGDVSADFAAKAASPSPGPATANQPSGGNDLTYIAPSPSLKPGIASAGQPTGALSVNSVAQRTLHARWRITADGHLERSLAGSAWTRVLAEQPVSFRVVAVTGNDVWAGGNNGALFHSVDGGEHWVQVVLSAEGHPETGAVVSIHFDTVSQGSVLTETGSTWTTSDRGQSWNK